MAVVDPDLRRVLSVTVLAPVWVAFSVVALPFALGVEVPPVVQYVPLVASALLFGMPHGAVDHLAVARLSERPLVPDAGGAVVAVYVLLGGAYAVGWFLAPVVASVGFILLTWVHWGQGDVYLLAAATDDEYPRSSGHRLVTLVVRGSMPMAVPLLAFPGTYREVVAAWVGLFDADLAAVAVVFDPGVRVALGAALAGLSVLTLAWGVFGRADGTSVDRAVVVDAVELGVLWTFFLAVPPVFAVGLYFCLWHAVRHIARLVLLDDGAVAPLREGRLRPALVRFARDAAPLTVVALGLLGVLYPLVPRPPGDVSGVVALYLVLIAVLTLPHVVVVSWMDRVQGVWRV